MIQNEETRTSGRQRILIICIAIFMLASTFALYASIVIGANNSKSDTAAQEEKQNRFNELYSQYLDLKNKQAEELSKQYFDTFVAYKSRVKSFNAKDVTEIVTKDLKKGSGKKVESEEFVNYAAYYIGWLSDETIFDSSFDDPSNPTSLISPLEGSTNMIEGWIEGIQGMYLGGIREITIPAALAYGETEQNGIPANSPLKFVVMLIEKPAEIEFEHEDELNQLLEELYGITD